MAVITEGYTVLEKFSLAINAMRLAHFRDVFLFQAPFRQWRLASIGESSPLFLVFLIRFSRSSVRTMSVFYFHLYYLIQEVVLVVSKYLLRVIFFAIFNDFYFSTISINTP